MCGVFNFILAFSFCLSLFAVSNSCFSCIIKWSTLIDATRLGCFRTVNTDLVVYGLNNDNNCRFAYVDFDSSDGLNGALGLDGSELNGYGLNVEEARPRGDGAGSGRGGGGRSGGGRSGGRDSGGRFGGRRGGGRGGGGGRFGGGGGRFGGGGRGRGTPYKPSFGSTGIIFVCISWLYLCFLILLCSFTHIF